MKKNNILRLTPIKAKDFLLSHEAFSNIELPPYFSFAGILKKIDSLLSGGELSKNEVFDAKTYETVNHALYGNKDGKYAWRKFEIINPALYVSLVNIITENENWKFLQNRFKEFQSDPRIECESITVLPRGKNKQKALQIIQWVNNIEKKSISLSLEYKFIYQTDISDCYGSIYTHSLPWAIHTKSISKNNRGYESLFGNRIDHHLQAMSHGQTNGIPQGSILSDFLAELVLGYADVLLSEKINEVLPGKKFHILRYRDDYRIFVNDVSDGDAILKLLSEVLSSLGFKLNTGKTFFSQNVVGNSIKPDKGDSLKYENIQAVLSKHDLIKQLLIIQQIGNNFPNSGTLTSRLSKIFDSVDQSKFKGNEKMLASLLVDIAYNNPACFPLVAGLISVCVSNLALTEKKTLLRQIHSKICNLSNTGIIEIWMQRMSLGINLKLNLSEKLCKLIYGEKISIFELSWILNSQIKDAIEKHSYINNVKLKRVKWKIATKEVSVFEYNN